MRIKYTNCNCKWYTSFMYLTYINYKHIKIALNEEMLYLPIALENF